MVNVFMFIGLLFLVKLSISAPYNCSIMVGTNVTWMQMLDGKTVLGGYSYYWPNGTLHNFDLEDNLITVGNYSIENDPNEDLCYEKEQYDYTLNIPATCNSFYVAQDAAAGVDFTTENGCLQFGNDCKFMKTCGSHWKNWWSAKIVNQLNIKNSKTKY
eukprot:475442_1